MTSETSSKIKDQAALLFSIFYGAVGIIELGYFAIESSSAPPHIPVLGILSLITAYTVFTMKKWALPLVVGLFFVGTTFGAATLSNSLELQAFGDAALFHLALIAYMIMLLIASVYIVIKRENFS
jgi:hypothetical protein